MADFDRRLHATLRGLGVDVAIREVPFGVPMATPFPDDREHASYDRDAVERFWRILDWSDQVFEEFAGWYCGKTSPVHLFWHSFDLALTRFDGRRAPALPDADPVTREAYSHEVVSFGFWAGDANVREPTYYAYAAPEPAGLREQPLSRRRRSGPSRDRARSRCSRTRPCAPPLIRGPRCSRFLESAYHAGRRRPGLGHGRPQLVVVPGSADARGDPRAGAVTGVQNGAALRVRPRARYHLLDLQEGDDEYGRTAAS